MTSSRQIYILLPVHNRCKITSDFIKCLKKQTYRNYHLVLIDDGSTDRTSETVLDLLPDATIIRGKGNWWWAGSLQQGYEWLVKKLVPSDDYVLVMNDDTNFDDNFLETGLSIIQSTSNTFLTAQGWNLKTGQPQDSGGYAFNWKDLTIVEASENTEINCLSTRGMLARVGDYLSVGGFYPKLVPHYLSDLEFTMRAHQKKNIKLLTDDRFRIYIDFDTTGYHNIEAESYISYLQKLFSRRSARNPIAWMNFIILRCPWNLKLQALAIYISQEFKYVFIPTFVRGLKNRIKKRLSAGIRDITRLIPGDVKQIFKRILPPFLKRIFSKYHDYKG